MTNHNKSQRSEPIKSQKVETCNRREVREIGAQDKPRLVLGVLVIVKTDIQQVRKSTLLQQVSLVF